MTNSWTIGPPAAVFDIETQGWDRYVLGGLYSPDRTLITRSEDSLVDAILSVRGDVWAHNGGKYDFIWLVEKLEERKIAARLTLRGGAILRMDVGDTVLRDSYAMIPMALEDAAPMAGSYKAPLGLPCVCGREGCKGYCAIKVGMPEEHYRLLGQYLEQDLEALWKVLSWIVEYASDNRIELRATIGASAWASARAELDLPKATWGLKKGDVTYHAARAACYGGRVEVYNEVAKEVWYHDINSSYPDQCVLLFLPVGKPRYIDQSSARRLYSAGAPGHFHARVLVEPGSLPPLPSRRNSRIVWGYGELVGDWTGDELRGAENEGARILDIGPSIVWPSRDRILAPWVERLWPLREAAGPRTPLGKWLKLLMNSLTGKFAQRPELEVHAMGPNPRPCPGDAPCDGIHHPSRCCRHRCTGKCGAWTPLGKRGTIWSRRVFIMPTCAHVGWYSHILSAARKKQRDVLRLAGDNRVYGDTDSCIAEVPLDLDIGPHLGQWDVEHGTDWLSPWPKFYRYRNDRGEWEGRGKGIPSGQDSWDAFYRGEAVILDRGVETLKSASRGTGKLFRQKWLERSRSLDMYWTGSRRRNPGGRSEAVDVAEWDYLHGHDSRRLVGYSDGMPKQVPELAREFGVSESTIRKWIHAGLLDAPDSFL